MNIYINLHPRQLSNNAHRLLVYVEVVVVRGGHIQGKCNTPHDWLNLTSILIGIILNELH